MKKILGLVIILVAVAVGTAVQAAPMGAGHLIIYRVGDNSAQLTNVGSALFFDEYQTNGTFVQTFPAPTSWYGGNYPVNDDATASAEGMIGLSADSRFIMFMGYGTTNGAGGSALPGLSATTVPRVIGLLDANGRFDTTTALTNVLSNGENPRSATSTDGTNLWFAGDQNGVRYTTRGSPLATQLTTFITNIRNVNIFSNTLYFSDNSGGAIRVGTFTNAMPITTSGAFMQSLPGLYTSGSPYAFVPFKLTGGSDPFDTLYVADDFTNAVMKWALVSGTWVNVGSITAQSPRGLTGFVDGSNHPRLWITSGGTISGGASLYSYIDTGAYNADPSTNPDGGDANQYLLVQTGIGTHGMVFRGIAFVPTGGTEPFPTGDGQLSVGPITGFNYNGLTGSPFGSKGYNLANLGLNDAVNWTATSADNWATITASSGSLNSLASTPAVVSFTANASSLTQGTNTTTVTFSDAGHGYSTDRQVNLILLDQDVSPNTDYTISGLPGGPFTPASKTYNLTNGVGPGTISWVVSNTPATWLSVSATSGSLAGGGGTDITFSVNANANTLNAGFYNATVVFSNATTHTAIETRNVTLSSGQTYWFDDFSTFSSGNLVGQNGWLQLGSSSVDPYQVTGGQLIYKAEPAAAGSGQTAYKNFPTMTNPVTFAGMLMTITSAVTNGASGVNAGPNYMGTFYQFNNGTVTGGFPNYRISAHTMDAAQTNFVMGVRTTGQAGAPWQFGAQAFTTGQWIRVIVQTDINSSNTWLYVNPTSANLGAQTPAAVGIVTGTPFTADPGVGSFGLSQYGGAISGNGGAFLKMCVSTNYADVYNFLNAGPFVITSATRSGNDIVLKWNGIPGANIVQKSTSSGAFTPSYTDLGTNILSSYGVTQYTDVGGATNKTARYYRVKGSR